MEEANKRFSLDAITGDELDIDRSRFNIDGRTIDYFYRLGESWYVWEQDGGYFYWRFQKVAQTKFSMKQLFHGVVRPESLSPAMTRNWTIQANRLKPIRVKPLRRKPIP